MKTYRINEIFYSIQGEGRFAGCPAVFIRFSGCNLKCPFCDTKHQTGKDYTLKEIVKEVRFLWPSEKPFVVLTGGEPTLQADADLTFALKKYRAYIAIETNGTNPVPAGIDWITFSPKSDYLPKSQEPLLRYVNELKLVYDGLINPEIWLGKVVAHHWYLQPCDTGNIEENVKITIALVEYVKKHPWWQISLQQQKILCVR